MSITLPSELDWVAKLAVGQDWPKGDEDRLNGLGQAWEGAAQRLVELAGEVDPATGGVLSSVGGQVAEEFSNFAQQLKSNLPDMAEAAGQVGQLGKNTALQVEYAKYMIVVQLIWLAAEIAELAFWAPEAIPALVTGVRAIVKMLLKRLVVSIAMGAGFMVGMDAVIQGIQFLKGDRTSWDTNATVQGLEGGAVGGAIAGVFSGVGAQFAPKFSSSLLGKGLTGGVSSVVTTEVMDQIFGGEDSMGAALTSGIVGSMGGGGGRHKSEGERGGIHVPGLHLPSLPDMRLPESSVEGGGGFLGVVGPGSGGVGEREGISVSGTGGSGLPMASDVTHTAELQESGV
ncbi:hypothetical protein ACIQ9L_45135, partial [Streptomyces sp. NPDC094468]